MNLFDVAHDYPVERKGREYDLPISETSRVYDELLVTLVQAGDRRAFTRLAARWQPRFIRTARRLLRDREEADAAVQESWIGIVAGIARLSDPAKFPAWGFGILHRKCADRISRRKLHRQRSADLGREPEPAEPVRCEDALAIEDAVAQLGLAHRTAAILYFGEGLTLAELATATGVPLGTAKSRIFNARRALKAALSEMRDDGLE